MRRILYCALFGILTAAPLLCAQDQPGNLPSLSDLSRRGEISELIQTANALLENPKLAPIEQGIVLTYLGHAYQQRGDFIKATTYYEKGLAVLDRDGQHASEYAITLGSLATLYAETGQLDTAKHVLLRSARLLEKEGDHHYEIAIIWNDLAIIAADARAKHEAHKCIARAIAESQLTANISPDVTSALAATQARIAELDGDAHTAISEYQESLALWKRSHADQDPETAWLYVLLGGAYLGSGDIADARDTTTRGLHLLEGSSGPQSPRFFGAELTYARVLDASGAHDEASKLRREAEEGLNRGSYRQSAQQQISVSALR